MIIGVLDLGSNAFSFLIWNTALHQKIFESKAFVKIGKDSYFDNKIKPEAVERAVSEIQGFLENAKEYKVEKIYSFATSAIRTANNQDWVCQELKKRTGIVVNIIDGDKEADLIFKGVDLAVPSTSQASLIMDIGGGSTEFLIFENHEVKWQKSYPLGVSRLLEMYHPSDPMTSNEKMSIYAYLKKMHNQTEAAILHYKPNHLIGAEGFFRTFFNILQLQANQPELELLQTHGSFNKHNLVHLLHEIVNTNYKKRITIKGLETERADSIPFAALSLQYILSVYSFDTIDVSNYSLKEGAIASILENKEQWQESLL